MNDMQYVTRTDFTQVTDAMNGIQETTLRVDERVKVLLERQGKLDININDIRNAINSVVNRVTILESMGATDLRIQVDKSREKIFEIEKMLTTLIIKESSHASRWHSIFDFVGKIFWIAAAAWMLYKMGFNPPPIS